MREIAALMDPRCLMLDPIGIYEWMAAPRTRLPIRPLAMAIPTISRDGYCPHPLTFADAPGFWRHRPARHGSGRHRHRRFAACKGATRPSITRSGSPGRIAKRGCSSKAGQPGHAAAWEDAACNAACRDFMENTRETLETSWVRPRYDGYMGLQDRAGDIVHACLRGAASIPATLDALDAAYRDSRA